MTVDSNQVWDPFAGSASDPDSARGREEAAFIENPRNLTTEVRESVSRSIRATFPGPVAKIMEAGVTWVSGCPHSAQVPLVRRSKVVYTVEAFGGFLLFTGLGHLALVTGFWWALPVVWLLVVGRGWALFNIFHHATHETLFRSTRVNRVIAFWASILSFSSSLDSYRQEHIRSHHTRKMCTYEDEEAAFMPLGLPPGMTKDRYYRRLAWLILTPWTYLLYTRYRLWDWQKNEPLLRKAAVWTFAAGLLYGAYRLHLMESLLLAYVVPMFVIFNITGLVGTFSEHHWGTLLDQPVRIRLVLLQQTRFLLDPAPDRTLSAGRRAGGWARWWARFLLYHLPVRIAVLPGDSMHHDHHHRHPRTEEWTMSTYERFEHLENGCPGFADWPHTHAWSLGEAIDRVFTRMSAARPPPVPADQTVADARPTRAPNVVPAIVARK